MKKDEKTVSTVHDDPWEGKKFIFPQCVKCHFNDVSFCNAFEKDRRVLISYEVVDIFNCPFFESKDNSIDKEKEKQNKEKAKEMLKAKGPLMDEKTKKRVIVMLHFYVKYKKFKAVYENEKQYICIPILEDGKEEFAAYYDKETKELKEIKISEYDPKQDIEKSVLIGGEEYSQSVFKKETKKED